MTTEKENERHLAELPFYDSVCLGDNFILLPNKDEESVALCCFSEEGLSVQTIDLHEKPQLLIEKEMVEDERVCPAVRYSISFDPDKSEKFDFSKILRPQKESSIRRSVVDKEISAGLEELSKLAYKLRCLGVSEDIINKTVSPEQKLIQLRITEDLRIIVPEYNNKEIELKPLPRALYLLFLKHPEGIAFKNLVDYKDELLQIYIRITNRWQYELNQKSIDDLVDPTKNSINEKCSRIRNAFVQMFNPAVAAPYCIAGKRGEPKAIGIDPSLVTWEGKAKS